MPPIQLLIKPASGACNLRCQYCFYTDEMSKRATPCLGIMSDKTLESIVQKVLESATGQVHFTFQGGEPTLAGLPFYENLQALIDKYNKKKLTVTCAIQTNGILLNDEWAAFLKKHDYLVGLSLDGPSDIHNKYRKNADGGSSYEQVMAAARLMQKYEIQFNVLCVVTKLTAKNIEKIYGFYKSNGFLYQQYIPCMDPLGVPPGRESYSLTPALYGQFLKKLFDLWYADLINGQMVYNRTFENWVIMLRGVSPEACGMMGRCFMQHVVEADGSVYPCDFYVLDRFRLGNLNTDSFEQLDAACEESGFIAPSLRPDEECTACRWFSLCRGGCRRYREKSDGSLGQSFFCKAYKDFFSYAYSRLCQLANRL